MLQKITQANELSDAGFPAGGYAHAEGVSISWQPKPLGGEEPTGAFVETLIQIVINRIEFYQEHVPCRENGLALIHLDAALDALNSRTLRRTVQGTEGTHEEIGDGTLADQVVPS